jgi:hypothetical protein
MFIHFIIHDFFIRLIITPFFKKKLIIMYSSGSYNGAINVCSTFNGKSIVELIACDNLDLAAANSMDSANNRTDVVHSSSDLSSQESYRAIF